MEALEFKINLQARPEAVWDAWTTEKGIKGFFAPGCRISIKPDGPYEILFDTDSPIGRQGSEGMRVLAVDPPSFLSFTWNAPPSIPAIRDQRTWVEIRITGVGGGSELQLTNGGYGDGPDWAKARAYFLRAWGEIVLPRLETYLSDGPVQWDSIG